MAMKRINESLIELNDKARVERDRHGVFHVYVLEPVAEGTDTTETHIWNPVGEFTDEAEAVATAASL